jgi:hypothetical protein
MTRNRFGPLILSGIGPVEQVFRNFLQVRAGYSKLESHTFPDQNHSSNPSLSGGFHALSVPAMKGETQ